MIRDWMGVLPGLVPVLVVAAVTAISVWAVHRVVALRFSAHLENKLPQQLFVVILLALGVMAGSVALYAANNKGVEFFVKTEPEAAVLYVRASV